jgi:hypothetical protein
VNVELALASLEDARKHPARFDMGTWYSAGDSGHEQMTITGDEPVPPCGTVGCYAGFVTFRTAPQGTVIEGGYLYRDLEACRNGDDWGHAEEYARARLGLTRQQSAVLFYLDTLEEVEAAVKYLADNPDADQRGIASAAKGYFNPDEWWYPDED